MMMSEANGSLRCPVCDGRDMTKVRPSEELELKLDYCDECGGMWFETGEVRELRLCGPEVLHGLVTVKKQLYAVDCTECGYPVTRNSAACKSCGAENLVDCPCCSQQLERVQTDRLTVDVCRTCRGAWFDNIDLSEVWKLEFKAAGSPESSGADDPVAAGGGLDTVGAILKDRQDGAATDGSAQPNGKRGLAAIAEVVSRIFAPSE